MAEKLVLITGAAGFIGRHAARLYARRGWKAAGIGRGDFTRGDMELWGVSSWRHAEVTLDALLALGLKPDVVIHAAGGGSVGRSFAYPLDDFNDTVSTTARVLEFMRLHAPEARLVLPSSAGVYGAAKTMPIVVDAPLSPMSPYGAHKKAAEEVCRSYSSSFGVRASIVRLFSVYGPGLRKQLLWEACRKLISGDSAFSGTGEEIRDWLHVDDAAELLYRAADNAASPCQVVNGGTGCGVSVRDVLAELADGLGTGAVLSFDGRTRAGDPPSYVADISAAASWGWSPAVRWRDGVREYAEWFKGL